MTTFGKHPDCPTSHQVLSYVEDALPPLERQRVAQHCAACDFCGAEAQLLAKFTPSKENYTSGQTPAIIAVLGVKLPLRRTSAIERRRAA